MDEERQQWTGARRTPGGGRVFVLVVTFVLTVVAFLGYRGELPDHNRTVGAPASVAFAPPDPLDPGLVTAAVRPALVNVNASTERSGPGAAGSGIVLTADGEVLTSHHVVKGADTVTVTDVGNGKVYDAVVLGYDAEADIALLDLAAAELPIATIGSSAGLRLREEVLAIGNAGGTGGAPTAVHGPLTDLDSAIVAVNAADLSRKALSGMLEVAAAVTPGQSGGALVDRKAHVVGVIAAASGDGARAADEPANGYAVPIDAAMRVVQQIRSGTPTDTVHIGPTATLGVLVSNALPVGTGARVDVAIYGMPAYAAGLASGDVITSIDGHAVSSAQSLRAALNTRKPNDTVRLGVTGAHGARTVAVVLVAGPPN
ncbi:trypsin-like peptidase domain-containing protein [Streptomyces gardneri]|nr:trypsin-like peptidase domain-containing protein [Streptomyces gardneri]MBF6203438.1 trypsin-like peptidase domain-containing protein [Streptomyces gardneri]UAK33515.1 S1C family serine protease [Nocardia asteroides]